MLIDVRISYVTLKIKRKLQHRLPDPTVGSNSLFLSRLFSLNLPLNWRGVGSNASTHKIAV